MNSTWSKEPYPIPYRLVFRVLSCAMLIMACTAPPHGTISLFDQIPEYHKSSLWQEILNVKDTERFYRSSTGLRKQPRGFYLTQSGGESEILFDIQADSCENFVVLLRYDQGTPWTASWADESDSVEVFINEAGGRIVSKKHAAGNYSAVFHLRSETSRPHTLGIRHLVKRGRVIPLQWVFAVGVPAHSPEGRIARINFIFNRLSRIGPEYDENIETDFLRFATNQKSPLASETSSGGCTKDCILLAPGDSITFDRHSIDNRYDLRLDILRYHDNVDPISQLCIMGLEHDIWKTETRYSLSDMAPMVWNRVEFKLSTRPDIHRLSVTIDKGNSIVAMGEPVLIPDKAYEQPKKNLIVIDLDTMRADRLGCYGYTERPTTTRLDSLLDAYGFYIFNTAYSPSPWTLPATAKMLTSRYIDIDEMASVPRRYATLAEILRNHGYYCIAYTGGVVLRFNGFEQGFHEYHWTKEVGKIEDTFPPAHEWLINNRIEPFVLFLHTYETHTPYTRDTFCRDLPNGRLGNLTSGEMIISDPPRNWRCNELTAAESLYMQAAYDGGVRYACDGVTDFVLRLDREGLLNNTVIFIVSDHGEELWDHFPGYSKHGHSLYAEMLNIPFMIYSPAHRKQSGILKDDEVSLVDLLPTALDLLGINDNVSCDGVSLVPALNGQSIEREIPILALRRDYSNQQMQRACVVSEGMKFITPVGEIADPPPLRYRSCFYWPPQNEVYDLSIDILERVNRAGQIQKVESELSDLLRLGLSHAQQPLEKDPDATDLPIISNDLKKQLTVLGYLSEE